MKCPKCKKEVKKEVKVCPQCGSQLEDDTLILSPSDIEGEEIEVKPIISEKFLLLVKKGPGAGAHFSLDKSELVLGRDPSSDIFLNDITVSRKHAKLTINPSEVILEDLGSLNGTYVNGERMEQTKLKDRDEIQIGKFKLVFFKPRRG